jgi:hypothetical protein
MGKGFQAPKVTDLGSVREMTQINKCGGSGDAVLPQLDQFTFEGCPPGP